MAIALLAKLRSLLTAAIQSPQMVIHFRELLQYQSIFEVSSHTYVSHTIHLEQGRLKQPEILKKEATIALPRHDGETPTNIFFGLHLGAHRSASLC